MRAYLRPALTLTPPASPEWLALANAYVDLGTWWSVTPVIGAGVGFSRNTISSYVDTNTPALGGRHRTGSLRIGFRVASAYRSGLQGHPGFTVELGYSYVNLWRCTDRIVSEFTGFANTTRWI